MARTILVTGGARSGKSTYAESIYQQATDVTYIAVARVSDEEMRTRIRLHQQARPQEWTTVEGTYNLSKLVRKTGHSSILLDCLTILTSNIMFDMTKELAKISINVQQEIETTVFRELTSLVQHVKEMDGRLVMVTNEVGYSIVPENHIARVYRDILGKINQRIAALCDEVYLVACGIPLQLK